TRDKRDASGPGHGPASVFRAPMMPSPPRSRHPPATGKWRVSAGRGRDLRPALTLAHDVAGGLVRADRQEAGVAELAVAGPFDERDLDDDLGADPVGAEAGKAGGAGEGRGRDLQR